MNNDKGFMTIKDGEYTAILNYLNRGDHLVGITLDDSIKIDNIAANQDIQAAEGIKGTEFVDIHIEIEADKDLARSIYDEMTELNHNHFKEYDERLVAFKVVVK